MPFKITKKILGKKITKKIRPAFHGLKGWLAGLINFFPSKGVYLIGISGTKGKTTTAVFVGKLLNSLGQKTGYISSALIFDGQKEYLNKYKMGMLDSLVSQKLIGKMVQNKCKFIVLEVTSEGLEQNRHFGLKKFDLINFLNIYPEHIEAHGSFKNYQKAKSILPQNLKEGGIYVHNDDSEQKNYFQEILSFVFPKLVETFKMVPIKTTDFQILNHAGSLFLDLNLDSNVLETQLISEMEVFDLVMALKIVEQALNDFYFLKKGIEKSRLQLSGFELDNGLKNFAASPVLQNAVKELTTIPGRMEWVIFTGENKFSKLELTKKCPNLSILVDYAHEPESMRRLGQTLSSWKEKGFFNVIIHLVSCDGAGRDDWKKPMLGKLSKNFSDYSILTTDNFDKEDNPELILDLLEQDLDKEQINKTYFRVVDRQKAINKALELYQSLHTGNPSLKILLVSTGVGSEQGLIQPEGVVSWDEREKWLETLEKV
jgi:UDP-N-acetylmuramoyl-L-alanyl-D-glutamate--2,6-diaminopimelate ligase